MFPQTILVVIYYLSTFSLVTSSDIVIVGAGLAGISAAAKLIENGHENVVILEAEDRIGGRVHSIPVESGGFIDLGAQLCHGEKGNPIFEMVDIHLEFGRPNLSSATSSSFYYSNGQPPDEKKCRILGTLLEKCYESSFENYNESISLGDFIKDSYEGHLLLNEFKSIDKSLAKQMLAHYRKQMNGYFACDSWDDVSNYYTNLYTKECEGNQNLTWKKRGFKTIIDFLTKKLPDPSKYIDVESKVQLKKEVVNIDWTSDNVTIACSDGSTYSADKLIFTGSLGVLKDRHSTLFTPRLPDKKVKAINAIGYGTLGKIFLTFETPFWTNLTNTNNDMAWLSVLWTDEDLDKIKGTDREWLVDLITFIAVDEFPNILQMFISGKAIPQFEAINDTKLIDDCMWLLEKFLQTPLPRPTKMSRTRWMTNRNFLGSYSYLSMASEKLEVSPNDLAQSLVNSQNKPIVLFAGEATHETYSSYSHGAIMSGWRVAEELIGSL